MSDSLPPRRPGPRVLLAGGIQTLLGLLSIPYFLSVVGAVRRADALAEVDALLILALILAQGALDVISGLLILRLRPAGWTLGVLMASFGALFALLSVGRASIPGLIGIGLRVTVVVLLALERDRFRETRSP